MSVKTKPVLLIGRNAMEKKNNKCSQLLQYTYNHGQIVLENIQKQEIITVIPSE